MIFYGDKGYFMNIYKKLKDIGNTQLSVLQILRFTLSLIALLSATFIIYTYYTEQNERLERIEGQLKVLDIKTEQKINRIHTDNYQSNKQAQDNFQRFTKNTRNDMDKFKEELQSSLNLKMDKSAFDNNKNEALTKIFAALLQFIEYQSHINATKNQHRTYTKDEIKFSEFNSPEWQALARSIIEEKRQYGALGVGIIGDGSGGVDTMSLEAGKILLIDGIKAKSFEIYNVLNGIKDEIHILAPGLVDLENNELEIKADPRLDKVVLDGCLVWNKEDNSSFHIFNAQDNAGEERKVTFPVSVPYEIQNECHGNYLQIARKNMADDHFDLVKKMLQSQTSEPLFKKSRSGAHTPNIPTPHQGRTRPNPRSNTYTLDKKYQSGNINSENLLIYKYWHKQIKNPVEKKNIGLLLSLMEDNVLPTEFLSPLMEKGHQPPYHSQIKVFVGPHVVNQVFTSAAEKCNRSTYNPYHGDTNIIRLDNSDDGLKLECANGNQIYHLNDGAQILDDSWGDDIVFPAKGDDEIDLGWGQDIVVLEENWGNKTIGKTCHHTKTKGLPVFTDYMNRPFFMGYGFSYRTTERGLFVAGVVSGSPAEKAGLKEGDYIVSMNNDSLHGLDQEQSLLILRNGPETVKFSVLKYPDNDVQTVDITKQYIEAFNPRLLNNPENPPLRRINYNTPYQYNSFIAFGPGIKKADLVRDGKTIRNLKTGDSLTLKDQCFELVFSDKSGPKEIPLIDKRGSVEHKPMLKKVEFNTENQNAPLPNLPMPEPIKQQLLEEHIENGQIATTVTQIKRIDAAVATFRDAYRAVPGDMGNAPVRIPDCERNCEGGNNDGIVGSSELKPVKIHEDERHLFWAHLKKANLINGMNSIAIDADSKTREWGKAFPRADIGGGFQIYATPKSGRLPMTTPNVNARPGTYLVLTNDLMGDFSGKDAHFVTPKQAARIDRKMDDGMPHTGSVIAVGNERCLITKHQQKQYDDNGLNADKPCFSLFIRISGLGSDNRETSQENEDRLIDVAKLTQYPSSVRTSIIRMIVSKGIQPEEMLFDYPSEINDENGLERYVFHPQGGGTREPDDKDKWIFSSAWEIDGIGTSNSGGEGNDVIAFKTGIDWKTCHKVNQEVGVSIKNNDHDNDEIPGAGLTISPTREHNITRKNKNIPPSTERIDSSSFSGQPFGCFDMSDNNDVAKDGPYIYYHVLIER